MKAKRRPQLSRTTKELLRRLATGYTAASVMILSRDTSKCAACATPESMAYARGRADVYNLVAVELLALCDKPIESDPAE